MVPRYRVYHSLIERPGREGKFWWYWAPIANTEACPEGPHLSRAYPTLKQAMKAAEYIIEQGYENYRGKGTC